MPLPKEKKHTADEYFTYTPEDNGKRYELIDGEYVALAAPNRIHQRIVLKVSSAIDSHISSNKGKCEVYAAPFDVWFDDHNVLQPDVLVVCDPEKLDDKRCYGAPDFVIEVLSTNRYIDLRYKLEIYELAGVREYWIVDPENEKTVVYFFEKSDLPDIYTFDTPIPVGIFGGELSINISELLK